MLKEYDQRADKGVEGEDLDRSTFYSPSLFQQKQVEVRRKMEELEEKIK